MPKGLKSLYTCMNMYIYIYMYTHTHTYIDIYIYTYVYIYIYVYIYLSIHTYIHTYIYIYTCMYVCMYVCIYIYTVECAVSILSELLSGFREVSPLTVARTQDPLRTGFLRPYRQRRLSIPVQTPKAPDSYPRSNIQA